MKTPPVVCTRPASGFTPASRLLLLPTALLLLAAGGAFGSRLFAGDQIRPSDNKSTVAPPPPDSSTRSVVSAGMTQVDLQQSQNGIRQQLLEATPKGTSHSEVRGFVSRQLRRPGAFPLGTFPVRSSTYVTAASADRPRKRLVVFLGFRHRGFEITTRTAFTAFYAFDEQDRLADIFLVQEEEHL